MEDLHDLNPDSPPSKTRRKQAMDELQTLGEQLAELPTDRLKKILAKLDLSETLADALRECQRITAHGARRRQLQYIGKLMRDADPAPIRAALDVVNGVSAAENAKLHRLERLRTRLMEEEASTLADIAATYPGADLTYLRQLRRSAQKEHEQNKPPRSFRSIFQALKDLEEAKSGAREEQDGDATA